MIREDNGVEGASVAYRKFLFKTIKAADEGNKFGQLFKPKAIAFDDDSVENDGKKYYVVDTYHHCIQCFERTEDINTVSGLKQGFKSSDEKFNNTKGFYLYDKNWNLVNKNNYNSSKMYSLGVRQGLIDNQTRGLRNEESYEESGRPDESIEGFTNYCETTIDNTRLERCQMTTCMDSNSDNITFRKVHGNNTRYLSVNNESYRDGSFGLNFNARSIGENETFCLISHGNNIFSLKSVSKNKYLTINRSSWGSNSFSMKSDNVGDNERFIIDINSDKTFSIKYNNLYLCITPSFRMEWNRSRIGAWEKLDKVVVEGFENKNQIETFENPKNNNLRRLPNGNIVITRGNTETTYERLNGNLYRSLDAQRVLINFETPIGDDIPNDPMPKVLTNPETIYLDNDYGIRFGQTYTDPDTQETEGVVKLSRWTSGRTNYPSRSAPFYYQNVNAEHPFFHTELAYDPNTNRNRERKLYPGLGEFLYPTDIAIAKNPFKDENLMFVTDMGNNRVSIFKKYTFVKNRESYKRFRFFRFLNDDGNDGNKLNNPFSVTVNKFNGKVYVLEGNVNETQTIKVFNPIRENNRDKNSSLIKYKHLGETIPLDNSNFDMEKKIRATKIRIDDRGLIAVTDINNSCIHIISEKLEGLSNITTVNHEENLSKISFNCELDLFKGINNINMIRESLGSLPNLNRLRFIFLRKNESLENKYYDLLMSQEYKYDFNLLTNEELINNKKNLITYDKFENVNFMRFWGSRSYGFIEPLDSDLVDNVAEKVYLSHELNMNVDKNYITYQHKFKDITKTNVVLDNYEDWIGDRLNPNSTYQYNFGIYNYSNTVLLNDDEKTINTLPIGISPDDIIIKDIVNREENHINFNINYGRISTLHFKTQKYNPICYYILRMKHNRSKDGMLKYLNVVKGQMIQLILPGKSKYILSKFSKPKYGKLYVYNAYGNGTVREQRVLMEEDTYYDNNKFIIFYCANGGIKEEGGIENIPSKDLINSDFIDDFFTVGDHLSTPFAKTKFRVRINITANSETDIILNDVEKLDSNLLNYSKNSGKNDDYSLKKAFKLSACKVSGSNNYYYPSNGVNFCDKGTRRNPIEPNQSYEYCVLTGNPFIINPAINTFFYTTKPEKVYIPDARVEKVMVNGMEKSFLKIIWYTPKNSGIYWPYNFLILRKQVKNVPKKIANETFNLDLGQIKMDKFVSTSNGIRLSPQESEAQIFEQNIDLGKYNDWKVSFSPFSMNEFGENNNKTFEVNNQTFNWTDTNRNYIFTGRHLNIKVLLNKNEMLRPFNIEKTMISREPNLEVFDEATNIVNQEIESKLENVETELNEEKRKELLKIYEDYRRRQKIGFAFSLSDDYDPDEISHHRGNTGELYAYLNAQEDEALLKIFDELNDKIIIFKNDVNMKMDGPQGMLRSGGRDMLIDKIRHLSYLLRNGREQGNESLNVVCNDVKLSDLISSQKMDNATQCINRNILKRKEEEKKRLEEERTERLRKIETAKKQRLQIAQQQERVQRELREASRQERESLLREQEEINNRLNESIEEQNRFEEVQRREQEESNNDLLDQYNMEQGAEILFNRETVTANLLAYTTLNIDIRNLQFNKTYIGEKQSLLEDGPAKYQVELKMFFDDLLKGYTSNTEIRNSYNQFYAVIYDFRRAELTFVKRGENPMENPQNIVNAPNFLLIPINQGPRAVPPEDRREEITRIRREITELQERVEDQQDRDLVRLQEYEKAVAESERMKLSLWSFIKDDKPDKFIEEPIQGEELDKLIKEYSIEPSTVRLSSNIIKGKDLFKYDSNLEIMINNNEELKKKILNEDYVGHKQMIELGRNYVDIKYEYRIAVYQTGYNFKDTESRQFMGMNYYNSTDISDITVTNSPNVSNEMGNTNTNGPVEGFVGNNGAPTTSNLENEEELLPYLNIGEVYSDPFYAGSIIENVKQISIPNIPDEIELTKAKEIDRPVIKFFEPKYGYENTVVRIVGTRLEELEYICFRDIKVPILRKSRRRITTNGKNEIFDELFVKPPTLKELERECWQSLERYKVLVWGYFRKLGVQIRSSEGKENLMFTYNTRSKCPDEKKLEIPK